jgi:SRSO17 transposase
VPHDVVFQTEPQIALAQVRGARAAVIDAEVALADAGYGTDTDFRDGVSQCASKPRSMLSTMAR